MRCDGQELISFLNRHLSGSIRACVLDGKCCTSGQVPDEGEVISRKSATRIGVKEPDEPDRAVVSQKRYQQGGAKPQIAQHAEVLFVSR